MDATITSKRQVTLPAAVLEQLGVGPAVLDSIRSREGCGLLDRLIVDDYTRYGVETLTHDRKMGVLPGATRL